MSATYTDKEHSNIILCFAKELVAGKLDGSQAEDEDESDEELCHNSPDHIALGYPFPTNLTLWLVESSFDDRPANCAENRLSKDDVFKPAMEEVEVLVGNASDQ